MARKPKRSLGYFRLNYWEPKGLPIIFPRVQPCSPLVIGSNDTLHAIVECEENANLSELPNTFNIYGGNIDVTFVLRNKGTLVY